MSEPVLDPEAVARLRRIGGDRLVAAMLESFLTHGAERVRAAARGAAGSDASEVAAAAHALKSSAGNVGATGLQVTAGRAEAAASAGADLAAIVEELGAGFDAAAAEVRVLRASLEPG